MELTELERTELARNTRVLNHILTELGRANTNERFYAAVNRLEGVIGDITVPGIQLIVERIEGTLYDIFEDIEMMRPLGVAKRNRYKERLMNALKDLIDTLPPAPALPAENMASVLNTEKDFLSKKVPSDVANKIGSYLSGETGSLGAQMSKLRVRENRSGVSNQGGRTKKNKSSTKKTRGRR